MRRESHRLLAIAAAALFTLAAAALLPDAAWALDLADGRIRLTLYEGIGRFSISCVTKGQNGIAVPLLAAQDPRTTTLSVVVGNRVYRLGESSEFSEKAEKVPGGGRFTWKSSFLQVTETFTFIASTGSPVTDGVRIDLNLKNSSEKDASIGARYLFDTYLGESSFVHFRTDTLTKLTHELALSPADKALYWVSPLSGNAEELGLQVMLSGTGVTSPDRAVFANWKRLSDSPWSYDVSGSRNFSLLPYSVNDSAVAQYYEPRPVAKGADVTITLALGKFTRDGFSFGAPSVAQESTPAATQASAAQSAAPSTAPGPDRQALLADLAAVDRILARLDGALSSGAPVPDDELAQMESILKDLGSGAATNAPSAGK
jgi:hypothetical protein